MKVRQSGMPGEAYWESLFDVPLVLSRLGITKEIGDVAELGCGYGTFTEPVAHAIRGTVYTFDVDPGMIRRTEQRVTGLPVVCEQRDVLESGFGVRVDLVLLFNILHCERAVEMLRFAAEAITEEGFVAAIHWRHGETPRGPSLDIRPRPSDIVEMASEAGLDAVDDAVDLPPWHYGLRLRRSDAVETSGRLA